MADPTSWNRIVVGTDGSRNANDAVRWATEEAAVHGATVEVLLAWSYIDQHHPDRSDTFDPGYGDDAARATLAAWVEEAIGPGAEVEQRVVCDTAAGALVDATHTADLVVVGARGAGGFDRLLLGSVSDRVTQHARGPVAVVREPAPVGGGRVVVGVDGSAQSRATLRWAAVEARARGAELDVVHAWRLPMFSGPPGSTVMADLAALEDAGRAVLDEALADPAIDGVTVRRHLTREPPARALIEVAGGAGLVVVGSRGHGRLAGALLGSVSRQLLHHAPCPVVVI